MDSNSIFKISVKFTAKCKMHSYHTIHWNSEQRTANVCTLHSLVHHCTWTDPVQHKISFYSLSNQLRCSSHWEAHFLATAGKASLHQWYAAARLLPGVNCPFCISFCISPCLYLHLGRWKQVVVPQHFAFVSISVFIFDLHLYFSFPLLPIGCLDAGGMQCRPGLVQQGRPKAKPSKGRG